MKDKMKSARELFLEMIPEDGTSVVDAFINRESIAKYIPDVDIGHLIIETDDGEFIDTGKVIGENGKDGKDGKNGKDGNDYILTNRDKEEIAREITVPIVEKVIEKTEIIKEVPIVTNEIKEVAKYEDGEQIVKKINDLELDEDKKIDAKHIKNLPESTTIIRNVASGIGIRKDGVNKTTDVKSINFTGSVDVIDNNGDVTVNVTGGGGGGGTRGSITGTLSDQTDLQTALDSKVNISDYTLINNDQGIDTSNVYGIDATNGEITLTLNDGTSTGQTLTVKKIDSSDNSVYVTTNSLIDGETSIEISMEGESYDFYWTGSTFNLK